MDPFGGFGLFGDPFGGGMMGGGHFGGGMYGGGDPFGDIFGGAHYGGGLSGGRDTYGGTFGDPHNAGDPYGGDPYGGRMILGGNPFGGGRGTRGGLGSDPYGGGMRGGFGGGSSGPSIIFGGGPNDFGGGGMFGGLGGLMVGGMMQPSERTATTRSGASYDISEEDLREIQDPHARVRPWPRPIHMREAAQNLMARTHPIKRTRQYREAWSRISRANRGQQTWDLITKMFFDIDTAIFFGELRSRVYMKWNQTDQGTLAHTLVPQRTNQRFLITMSTNSPWGQRPRDSMLGTLIHEMIHAYFNINCGPYKDEEDSMESWRGPGHGSSFMRVATWIGKKLDLELYDGANDGRSIPLMMGCRGHPRRRR